MKIRSILLFIFIFVSSACAALAAGPGAIRLAPVPTASPTAYSTATVVETPALPTPTAMPLPTRIVERPAPPADDATPAPTPQSLLDEYLPGREVVAESDHFIFYAQDDFFPVDRDWMIEQAEIVYNYVSQRLEGADVENKVEVGFLPPDERTCPVRGLASHSQSPMVILYASEESPEEYILGVLAHEVGHAIPTEGFPTGLPDDQPLTEGLATWASGRYWADWIGEPSLEDIIRGYIERGEYEPLYENFEFTGMYPWHDDAGEDCLDRRDKIYAEWGVFLGYLVETYGWDKAYRLFDSPDPVRQGEVEIQFPPDYEGIYGLSLNQLEYEWLQALETD